MNLTIKKPLKMHFKFKQTIIAFSNQNVKSIQISINLYWKEKKLYFKYSHMLRIPCKLILINIKIIHKI